MSQEALVTEEMISRQPPEGDRSAVPSRRSRLGGAGPAGEATTSASRAATVGSVAAFIDAIGANRIGMGLLPDVRAHGMVVR
jgi:hypothetical protein